MKCQVPRGVPGILPLVGHGNHIGVVEVCPILVAAVPPLSRRRWTSRIAFEPLALYVVIELLRPQQPSDALPHHVLRVFRKVFGDDPIVELVRLQLARHEHTIEFAVERIFRRRPFLVCESQLDGNGLARRDGETVIGRGLGSFGRLVHGVDATIHYEIVDAVLAEHRAGRVVETTRVGFVFREQY